MTPDLEKGKGGLRNWELSVTAIPELCSQKAAALHGQQEGGAALHRSLAIFYSALFRSQHHH